MAGDSAGAILKHVQTLFTVGAVGGLSDGQLLERFARGNDPAAEAAFEALVDRHGPMVLSVCQSVLGNWHDAQDTFQGTFLVLARKAGSIRRAEALASWLFGVARRLSARAKVHAARRRALERRAAEEKQDRVGDSNPPDLWRELYEELDRLPEKFRAPIVLCHLEGKSYEQAASRLQWPLGTVQSRLSRGRDRLRDRLSRRGLAPSVVGLASTLTARPATAAVSSSLREGTVRGAVRMATGQTMARVVSASSVALARSFLRSQVMTRLAILLSALMIALAAVGAGVLALQAPDEHQKPARTADTIHVRVVDLRGRAVPETVVLLARINSYDLIFRTDARGRLLIPTSALGEQASLLAHTDERTLGWTSYGLVRGNPPAGTDEDPYTLTLLPLTRRVQGSVVDLAGKPIAGVRILPTTVRNEINGAAMLYGTRPAPTMWPLGGSVTDAEGRFVITLPERTWSSLEARHSRFCGPEITCDETSTTLEPVTLEPAGSIVGTVFDEASGKTVEGAAVGAQLLDPHERFRSWASDVTDAQGRFAIGGLGPGVYNLLLLSSPKGKRFTAMAIEGVRVGARQDTRADMRMIEGCRLGGTVSDAQTGEPLAGKQIGYYGTARPRSGAAVMTTRTDAEGQFELFVPPGLAYVYLMERESRLRGSSQPLIVPADKDADPIRLLGAGRHNVGMVSTAIKEAISRPARKDNADRNRTMTGRVVDASGRPIAGVRVFHVGEASVSASTDREGVYVLKGLPPGQVAICAFNTNYEDVNVTIDADRGTLNFVLEARPMPRSPAPRSQSVPLKIPAEVAARLTFVDLQLRGTDRIDEGPNNAANSLTNLPIGVQKFEDVWFSVGEKMIHLAGQDSRDMPEIVEGIEVNATFESLHILHATQHSTLDGTEIGAYVVHYADGSKERIPIIYGKDLCDWIDRKRQEFPTHARIVWAGSNDSVEKQGLIVRIFARTWQNPHPEKRVATIHMESKMTVCDPFLVALTLEKK